MVDDLGPGGQDKGLDGGGEGGEGGCRQVPVESRPVLPLLDAHNAVGVGHAGMEVVVEAAGLAPSGVDQRIGGLDKGFECAGANAEGGDDIDHAGLLLAEA